MTEQTAMVVYNVDELTKLGGLLAASGFFGADTKEAQAVVKILAGRELGLAPVASMRGIYLIKGSIAIGANLIAMLIKQSGRYNYVVKTLTDDECELEITEGGKIIGVSRFTMADAKKAGLLQKSDRGPNNWESYPRNMLFARAVSNAARWYCADVFNGAVYTPDELGAATDERGDVVESTAREVPPAAEPPKRRTVPTEPPDFIERGRAEPPKRSPLVQAAVDRGATIEDADDTLPRTDEQAARLTSLLQQHRLPQRWLVEQGYTLPLTRAMAAEAIATLEAMGNG